MTARQCTAVAATAAWLAGAMLIGASGAPRAAQPAAPVADFDTVQDCTRCPPLVALPGGRDQVFQDRVGSTYTRSIAPLLMGKYEVTEAEWTALMGPLPSGNRNTCGPLCPVSVLWSQAQAYVQALSRLTGQTYRLPTDDEWTYAARAGSAMASADTAADTAADAGADQPPGTNHPAARPGLRAVGSRPANRWGLHDLHGNAWEWLADADDGPDDGAFHALRGGSWAYHPSIDRMRYSERAKPAKPASTGLRVVRERPAGGAP